MKKNKLLHKISIVSLILMLMLSALIVYIQLSIYTAQAKSIASSVRSFLIIDDFQAARSKLNEGLNIYEGYELYLGNMHTSSHDDKVYSYPIKIKLENLPNGFVLFYFGIQKTIVILTIFISVAVFIIYFIFKRELVIIEREFNLNIQSLSVKQKQELLTRITHDMRSPLMVLEELIVGDKISDIHIFKATIRRLYEFAENFLEDRKKLESSFFNKFDEMSLQTLITSKIIEKKLNENQIQVFGDIVNVDNLIKKYDIFDHISNVLNNSIEACENNNVSIKITMSTTPAFFFLVITDNGPGFPKHVIAEAGRRELSCGKKSGNGIALYSLFQYIERHGGSVAISNALDPKRGASVEIKLPMKNIEILIDDDELVRMVWDSKAKDKGIDFKSYEDSSKINFEILDKKTTLYIDSKLANGLKGEDLAQKLHNDGFKNIYLATGYSPDDFKHLTFLKGVIGKSPPWV